MWSVLFVVLALCVVGIQSHSWVACTDYRFVAGGSSEKYYDDSRCFGYPPGWGNIYVRGSEFGGDAGYNFQSSAGSCQGAYESNAGYTTEYPQGIWKPGDEVCLAWPAKNHAKGSCTNENIPDGGVVVIIRGATDTIIDLGSADDGSVGFQNCPAFCEDGVSDKILCHRCFTVPGLPNGNYEVAWEWVFNPGDPYITCFNVIISSDGNTAVSDIPPERTVSTTSSSNPGSTTSGDVVVLGDYNAIMTKYPVSMPGSGSVDIEVAYRCRDSCRITIDLLSGSNAWFGKGYKDFLGFSEGTTTITLTPQNSPAQGSGYRLTAWTLEEQFINEEQSWTFESSRHEVSLSISDTLEFNVDEEEGNNAQFILFNTLALVVLFM